MKKVPDPRNKRKKMHDSAEILTYIILAYLCGRHSLRRALQWAENNIRYLKKYMKLRNGIASVSTVHRLLRDIDSEELNYIFMQWMAQLLKNRRLVISIDGKGLRGATDRISNGKTPYILNAIDVTTRLVIAQFPIAEKANEITEIPKLLGLLDLTGNIITIDAIGTQWKIMDIIAGNGGFYLLTVKENQPGLKEEIFGHFRTVKKRIAKGLKTAEEERYECSSSCELNRGRIEYRKMEIIQDNPIAGKDELAYDDIRTIGIHEQIRIPIARDRDGNDITPDYNSFKAQAIERAKEKRKKERIYDDEYLSEGMISNKEMTAEEMAQLKRDHWTIENNLHHVLDDLFREDRSSARVCKNNLSLIRKFCFNLCQVAIHNEYPNYGVTQMLDKFSDDKGLLAQYVFKGLKTF